PVGLGSAPKFARSHREHWLYFMCFPVPRGSEEASPMSVTPEPHSQSIGKLVISALKSLVVWSIALGVLLFLPAGTLNYWQAWVLIAVFVPGSIATGIYLRLHDPELLERRKQVGPIAEIRPAQKLAISVLILAFFGMCQRRRSLLGR